MIDFKEITIEDKAWIDQLLRYSDYRGAEYCFTNLFIWSGIYQSKIARYKDFLLLRSSHGGMASYLYPAGTGDRKEVLDLIIDDASRRGEKSMLISMSGQAKKEVEDLYPGRFDFFPVRESFDYIYESEKLITLSGKKLQPKRNYINRFKELPDWKYEDLTLEMIPDVIEFNKEWCKDVDCGSNKSLGSEVCAVSKCLNNYRHLGLSGGVLRVAGKIVAYTIGEAINSDTVIVHIEKAFAQVKGAYPMINREFAERQASEYKYISREDDAGDIGLRKAKESYCPVFMQEKYSTIIF